MDDKFIIEACTNYVYQLECLKDKTSTLTRHLKMKYPNIIILDIQTSYLNSNLGLILLQDTLSKDVAIIFQGSTNINDWKNDNLNNFFKRNVKQYEYALSYFETVKDKGYRISYLAGNSLGGGCALFVSLKYSHIKTITVNAAPLININDNVFNNVINIRINSDLLTRVVMLDKERFDNGYQGKTLSINRSLYGQNNYYNCIELAHRGSIIFPYEYFFKKYSVTNLTSLKTKVDNKEYIKIKQLFQAPSLAQFMSFDLITNNIDETAEFDLVKIQSNFDTRISEMRQSLLLYHQKNLELCIGQKLIKINSVINQELKDIIKYSLLKITKQEDKLYDGIYFIIEKSTNYFYKLITSSLAEIENEMLSDLIAKDYQIIINNISLEKKMLNTLLNNLETINTELSNLEKFTLKDLFIKKTIVKYDFIQKPFNVDYRKLLYQKIDDSINQHILENKSFIKQITNLVSTTLKAGELTFNISSMKLDNSFSIDNLKPKVNYNIKEIIQESLVLFKEDIYSTILTDSLLYNYQVHLRCINEQLEQLLITLNNLKYYLEKEKQTFKIKRVILSINDTISYINSLINSNMTYITL